MAVQAQYASNVLLMNRNEQERKDMDFSQSASGFLHQSSELFANGGNGNPRKRVREAAAGGFPTAMMQPQKSQQPINLFGMQPQNPSSTSLPPPTIISLAQLQTHPPPLVSTGLRLSFEDHQNRNEGSNRLLSTASSASSSLFSSLISEELAAQINQQKAEIEKLLHAQGEQLRRALAEKRRRHYQALLGAAEESAARQLREKEAEVERAARRRAELEDRLARLRTESMAWQAKAMSDQATAASLHAQIQQATAAAAATASLAFQGNGEECGQSPPAEDAESAYIDPDRVEPERACRACGGRPATVVLLPCRHLCLCEACDADAIAAGSAVGGGGLAADSCPVCLCVRTGSVQVFLS